jgi:G3E family GTPase
MNQSAQPAPLPIYVLAGVLGSGKTTLMARLAQHCIAAQHRVGMIVNDIGDLGVDAMLLAETGWPHAAVDSLNGECACCSDSTDLEDVLLGMKELRRELLLFETTGVADAADMLNQLTAHHLRRLIDTPRLISVIDLTRYPDPLRGDPLVRRQVALADAVVLSKSDLVDEARVAAAMQLIQAENAAAPILAEPIEALDVSSLFEIGVQHQSALESALAGGPPGHSLPHTVTLPLPRKLDHERFAGFLHAMPATILRAKGFVALNAEPALHSFQYVEPGFVHIAPFVVARRPGVVMASGTTAPYGVFIGTTIDEAWLRAALAACAIEAGPQG